ncbi:Mu transposase domain-containing protein [Kitasatospora sp. NPDC052896]|uniref:Mu transposase domain-containing protein n=1 Tax=Kitasatospora sp. NPDC052896 TaxID=3364061 RepID=UPI0037CC76F4
MGVRVPSQDHFLRFLPYCRQRFSDDPHLRASVLFGEVVELGYPGAYSTFTRALRKRVPRPNCGLCQRAPQGLGAAADSTPGEDVQFDWVELYDPPAEWGCGSRAHLLMGSLTLSSRWRAALTQGREFAHCVEAMDQVMRRLGGTGERWLFDRTAPMCSATGRVTAAFTSVARYYGASVAIRTRDGQQAPVDRSRHSITQRWWHSMPKGIGMPAAQASLDRLAELSAGPRRPACDTRTLLPLPAKPFPARFRARRTVGAKGLVCFEGNFYALPPDLAGAVVNVHRRLDEPYVSITTEHGAIIARFVLAPLGAGQTVLGRRDLITLERPVRASRSAVGPCPGSRGNRPPSPEALAEAEALLRGAGGPDRGTGSAASRSHVPSANRPAHGCQARARYLSARPRR